ncbi:MAG: class I SAM-dependent methyltransferase [Thermoplasmatota archaeon]
MIDEKTAEKFALYMKKYPGLYVDLADMVKQYVSKTNPIIVDLGVGPGFLSKAIHEKIHDATIIGIDPNVRMLELAKENTGFEFFKPLLGYSDQIPLEEACADVIVSRFSLSYWSDPVKSFQEISRVLKNNGYLIIEAINKDFSLLKLFFIKIHMLIKNAGPDVTKYHIDVYKQAYTMDEVVQFFLTTGFSIVKRQGTKKEWKFLIIGKK